MGKKREEIIYTYRGQIEVGRGGRYEWRDGYSATSPEGYVQYPWMTQRQCQQMASAQGKIARFVQGETCPR